MSNSTTFIDQQTVITAGWLNDTNSTVFTKTFPDGTHATTVEALSAASGSGLVGYIQDGTGSTPSTVQSKLQEFVSIKDFGAKGDGVTDDSAAFEAMVTVCAATGTTGRIPAGTYLIDTSSRTFLAAKPFTIMGDGRGVSTLKNRNTAASFIYWTGANGASFENLKIDGNFTGLPSVPSAGGTLVLENSSNNAVRGVDFVNIYRVALLIYNDHQTTTANVYGGHVVDNCRAYGPSNYSNNVGPSAFILADVNDSTIRNCYINNIGLYGYEFKNDCSNTIIANCIAEDTFYPLYYGGNGVHTELGYVKNSLIEGCIVRRAQSGSAIVLGLASNNTVRNINIDQTGVSTTNFSVYIHNSSNNNSVTGISLVGRNYEAAIIKTSSNNNTVEFSSITDGSYSGRGSTGITSDCSNNTMIFGNRDSTQNMFLNMNSFNANSVIDKKFHWDNLDPTTSGLKRIRFGDVGEDNIPSVAKGFAVIANTADYFQTSAQDSTYQYFGSFSKYNIAIIRYRLTDGTKLESLYDGSTTATYITSSNGYYPNEDNTRKLGAVSNRWSTIYAGTGTINTSDAREKQQGRPISELEKSVATRIKSGLKAFKWNNAVQKKGESARWHFGVYAQEVAQAFIDAGLDPHSYGLFCYDKWDAVAEEKDVNGNVVTEGKEAGDRYGVRYDELLAFLISSL